VGERASGSVVFGTLLFDKLHTKIQAKRGTGDVLSPAAANQTSQTATHEQAPKCFALLAQNPDGATASEIADVEKCPLTTE
jgi:hypothetical protein